jgi:hypothetical protein
MKLTIIKTLIVVLTVGFAFNSNAQVTCDSVSTIAANFLKPSNKDKRLFISDGQVYRAFLDEDQSAEFETTFYGGSVYRIAASAGADDSYVIFEVYDKYRNLIFTNRDYKNAEYWDFKVNSTIDCTIEVKLDLQKKSSGCAVLLIGFEKRK